MKVKKYSQAVAVDELLLLLLSLKMEEKLAPAAGFIKKIQEIAWKF